MQLALRIEVDSVTAARTAVPKLVELLQTSGANATFFINMGPDRSGKAGGKRFHIGETRRQIRRNKAAGGRHGMARFYGTLLPAPDVITRAGDLLLTLKELGFDTGIRAWDSVNWVRTIDTATQTWLRSELEAALYAYENLFGSPAKALAMPGWRSNRAAIRLEQLLGLKYGSDCRGIRPFLPVLDGEPVRVPQLPTTLPTLSELIGEIPSDEIAAVANLLEKTEQATTTGHVFTLNADSDTGKRLPLLAQLLAGWQSQGYEVVSMQQYFDGLDVAKLPWYTLEQQAWAGYSGQLSVQGSPFPK